MPNIVLSGGNATWSGFDMAFWNSNVIITFVTTIFPTSGPTLVTYTSDAPPGQPANVLRVSGTFTAFNAEGDPTAGTITGIEFVDHVFGNPRAMTITGLSLPVATVNAWILSNNVAAMDAALFDGDDVITGGAFREQIYGYAGNDSIDAGGGDDRVVSGLGNDTIFGGDGNDEIDFGGGGEGNDVVDGGAGADRIGARAGVDTLDGGSGQDYVELVRNVAGGVTVSTVGMGTQAGATLYDGTVLRNFEGGSFSFGAGNDTLVIDAPGIFNSAFAGGGGVDTLVADFSAYSTSFFLNPGGQFSVGQFAGYSLYNDVERFVVTTGSGDDQLRGGTGNDILNGGAGADLIFGREGDDVIVASLGADTIYGGGNPGIFSGDAPIDAGNDTVTFATWTSGVTAETGGFSAAGASAAFTSIENLIGSAFNDTLSGNELANLLSGGAGDDVLSGFAGIDTLDGGAGVDMVALSVSGGVVASLASPGSIEDTLISIEGLRGWTGNDTLTGEGGANRLEGLGGDDVLQGLGGSDTLVGGQGSDSYGVDADGDVVTELSNEGFDTVYASINYVLGAHVEALNLIGAAVNGFGNGLANAMTGNALANYLTGEAGDDVLRGNGGNDILEGAAGNDIMFGGLGDDSYGVDSSGDAIGENVGEGFDAVYATGDYTLGANLEQLNLLGSAVNGFGNGLANAMFGNDLANYLGGGAGDDVLTGGGGNDILEGSTGNDIMFGGLGSDSYGVDSSGDAIGENVGEGFDAVYATGDYTLGANLEQLNLIGGAVNGFGNSLANSMFGNELANYLGGGAGDDVITGGAGNDILEGNTGNDIMFGGLGSDSYGVDSSGDAIGENVGEGFDAVYSTASYTLGANLEQLNLIGSATEGYGNGLANAIFGNALNNILNGGTGDDVLNGGAGNDTFLFLPGTGHDVVSDFVAGGTDDRVDLSAYAGTGITYVLSQAGGDAVFNFSNGDQIVLVGVNSASLVQSGDFWL